MSSARIDHGRTLATEVVGPVDPTGHRFAHAPWDPLLGLLPLRSPRLLGGPTDRLAARRLTRGLGPCRVGVVPRRRFESGLLVFTLRTPGASAVVKRARDARAAAVLVREWEVLGALLADPRLAPWRALLPRALGPRPRAPVPVLAQERLPGTPWAGPGRGGPPPGADPVLDAVLDLLAAVRQATGQPVPAADRGASWTAEPLGLLASEVRWCRSGAGAEGLAALRLRLHRALRGAVLTEGWTHTDLHPGNVLLDGRRAVTGVVDWGGALPAGPAELDACTAVLTVRSARDGRPLGRLVADALRPPGLPAADRALLVRKGAAPDGGGGDPALLPLLAWLWHVAGNVRKAPGYGRSTWWTAGTVAPVLRESARWARGS
ncbi:MULTISPECIES: phosphotransferase family protein [unclassified Streptomyces]|uniref:phosphotransferase family protein n=1 Tax=unclassified Streptomyces TaxID=2593676 RepID=UPI003820DB9E